MVTALRVIMIHITPQLNQFSYLYCFNSEPLLVPRATLSSLYTYAGDKLNLFFCGNRDGLEVAVAYFRAGYAPKHYPTEKVRLILPFSLVNGLFLYITT